MTTKVRWAIHVELLEQLFRGDSFRRSSGVFQVIVRAFGDELIVGDVLVIHKSEGCKDFLVMLHLIDCVTIAGIGVKGGLSRLLVLLALHELLMKCGVLLPRLGRDAEYRSLRLAGYVIRFKSHDKLTVLRKEHFLVLIIERLCHSFTNRQQVGVVFAENSVCLPRQGGIRHGIAVKQHFHFRFFYAIVESRFDTAFLADFFEVLIYIRDEGGRGGRNRGKTVFQF